ncbi:MAG TPA: TolC family protein [Flavipsychrobacter sp.]|nr:TolC family protein [Flavipsychrobacter sp.]
MFSIFTKGRLFIALSFSVLSTINTGAQTVLDGYINEAFKNNNDIRRQNLQLEKSLYALKEARSLFLPNIGLLGSYTKAAGGRTIDIPVGDLLNPVYSTLNQLTETKSFPQLKNTSVLLNPDNFYDAKFRTALPLIDAEIYYNNKIKKALITQQQAAVNVYRRELVKEIKFAYCKYYQAGKAIEIYNSALVQVNENIRVNESMLRNGVRNSTSLTRAETEKQKINASITQAQNDENNAQSYFNFLLNKPLETPIALDTDLFKQQDLIPGEDINVREELTELKATDLVYNLNTKLQRSYLVPKLNTFIDLGSQGFNWDVNNKTAYYLWGVNFEWDLFAAGRNQYKIKQAALDVQSVEAQYDQSEKTFALQLSQAKNNYNTAVANYNSAKTQLSLASKYYNDQMKVYKEGQLLYIELLDALNQLTDAQLQLSVSVANVQVALADIERCNASYPLDKNN